MKKNNIATAVACLAMGALAGYLSGILTAQKTGKELRQDIKDETEKLTKQMKDSCDKLRDQAEQKVSKFKDEAVRKYREIRSAGKGKKFNLANQINQIFHRSKTEV